MKRRLVLILFLLFTPQSVWAKKKVKYRKSQDVNFDGSSIDGVARAPDGAYLHQRTGMKFLPLYKVRKQFDENIKNSVEYLR